MTSLVDAQHLSGGFDPIEYASSFVRSYCNQRFDYVADDEILISPLPNSTALLPELPVSAVSSVQAWMPSATGQFEWQTLTSWAWEPSGWIYDTTGLPGVTSTLHPSWPKLPASLKVTYTHGYQVIPDDLQSVVLRIAAEIAANPDYLHSEKVGEINTVWANNPVAGGAHIALRDQDKWILDRYSKVGIS